MNLPATSRWLAWLQLLRLPNVFTAMADVTMGFLLTHAGLQPLGAWLLLLAASSCLYLGGVVLNDVHDLEVDRRERPGRPLPSGRIDADRAHFVGSVLVALGVIFGLGVRGFVPGGWWVGTVAMPLAALVVFYNRWLKHTPLGPAAMGGCRGLNVLLGMSASPVPWTPAHLLVAGGVGVYIAGLSWFARDEAQKSRRPHLAAALAVMLGGMAMLWRYPAYMPFGDLSAMLQLRPINWSVLWLLLALSIGWRAMRAIAEPEPAQVQAAIKSGILSLIMLDAVVVLAVHPAIYAIGIVLLLAPTLVLARWVYST